MLASAATRVSVHDETLRDGLQSPSVRQPGLDQKLALLAQMDRLGLDSADIGMMADMDQLRNIRGKHGLALVEDCAQAHGAVWNGRRAGTIGAFSMQQSKVLTCGEGGAVVTRDARTYSILRQLRSDSAGYDDGAEPGTACLSPIGDIMGTNYHLSEPQAAILLDRLPAVDAELDLRDENARYLNEQLARVPGVRPLEIPRQLQRVSVFEFAVMREEGAFDARPTAVICDALSRELGIRVYQTDLPLHRNIRYQPWTKTAWRFLGASRPAGGFPVAERLQALFSGRRYDTGDKLDYLRSTVRLACDREDLGPEFRSWLRDFVAAEMSAEPAGVRSAVAGELRG